MNVLPICVTLLAILAFEEVTAATNYCKASLCGGSKHIGCKNNGALANTCSKNAKVIPVTPAVRNAILKRHNVLRNRIASGALKGYRPAARMATMQWNAELAKLAVLNVKQCAMVHDACRSTDQFRYAGQNLAYTAWYGQTLSVQKVALQHVQSWFDEYKDASMAYINKYSDPKNGKDIGHFTQLVNERANRVGCGILRETKGQYLYQYMACNYAYINVMGRSSYISGKAGSKCKTGRNPNYKSLCSIKERFPVNTI